MLEQMPNAFFDECTYLLVVFYTFGKSVFYEIFISQLNLNVMHSICVMLVSVQNYFQENPNGTLCFLY